jgi:hypothetical protein
MTARSTRTVAVLLAIITALAIAMPRASAVPVKKAPSYLAAAWKLALETPSDQNPFGTGDPESGCFDIHGTLAPFGPLPGGVAGCTVKPGTKLFVTASSWECSTIEGNGTTEAELRACAEANDAQSAPTLIIDGRQVTPQEVETPLTAVVLPGDNIFGLPAGTSGQFVAHGWVTLLHPLTPGTHHIVILLPDTRIDTAINVVPGH